MNSNTFNMIDAKVREIKINIELINKLLEEEDLDPKFKSSLKANLSGLEQEVKYASGTLADWS